MAFETIIQKLPSLTWGVGFNWFDFFGMGGGLGNSIAEYYPLQAKVYPELDDAAGWCGVMAALDTVQPSFIRFGLPPEPHLPDANGVIANTVHLERLKRVATWAGNNNCVILLDCFLLPQKYCMAKPSVLKRPNNNGMWQMACADPKSYATEFVVPLLDKIRNAMGLTAVSWFNAINEPMCYGIWQTPEGGDQDVVSYVNLYRELRSALDVGGFDRSTVGLVGMDLIYPQHVGCAEKLIQHGLLEALDAVSVHFYHLQPEDLNPGEVISTTRTMEGPVRDLVQRCLSANLSVFAAEIGTFQYGWRGFPKGVASHEAVVTVATGILRGIGQGLSGAAFWSLFNPDNVDGYWSIVAIEDSVATFRNPKATVYGELSRALRRGAKPSSVLMEDNRHFSGLRVEPVEERDGAVLFLTNDSKDTPVTVTIDPTWFPCDQIVSFLQVSKIGVSLRDRSFAEGQKLLIPPLSFVRVKS